MSKLTKFVKSPRLFFKDALINLVNKNSHNPSSATNTSSTGKKPALTLDLNHVNPFLDIELAIHTGENMTHGPSHLSMWIPYFLQAKVDFVVIVRFPEIYKWVLQNYPYVNVIYAKTPQDIENTLSGLPYLKAIFYLSNTGNLIHSIRFNQYQHIFLGHGDSDKTASAHKFFRVYDQIWVAGQAHIDRFKNAGFSVANIEFIKVGRPTLNKVIEATVKPWQQRNMRLLYLPTWEGVYEEGNYSSIMFAKEILMHINKTYQIPVSAKFHPVTGSRNKLLAKIEDKVSEALEHQGINFTIADKLTPVADLLVNANIFICDISAVVSECIAANGPIFVYIPQDKEIKVAKSDMDYDYYAYTFSSLEELYQQLEQVLNGNDYKAEQRAQAREYLIGCQQTINHEFVAQLQQISMHNQEVEQI
ncbi:CDP-glycerol glycerophosphotransferase family protein [Psittacicella gerlachiana]|uniref:CDP-glycerol:poly(Glycerophosphate) glycerophosphotransferase n=1 Tax=Psittacicella gerlachiana TaxID=2028574 RepID=A0A3A1YML1_9GAMM|nr:CDP-glycerol glycerophosphotransferase family protein [Psittacicella gerlachiana]RIY38498.1 hypothetical protein CKF59_00750 [Psittacicella gerlachiana]